MTISVVGSVSLSTTVRGLWPERPIVHTMIYFATDLSSVTWMWCLHFLMQNTAIVSRKWTCHYVILLFIPMGEMHSHSNQYNCSKSVFCRDNIIFLLSLISSIVFFYWDSAVFYHGHTSRRRLCYFKGKTVAVWKLRALKHEIVLSKKQKVKVK